MIQLVWTWELQRSLHIKAKVCCIKRQLKRGTAVASAPPGKSTPISKNLISDFVMFKLICMESKRRRKYPSVSIIKNVKAAIWKSIIYYNVYIYTLRKKRGTETIKDCNIPVMLNLLESQHGCISERPEIFSFQPKMVKFGISQHHRTTEQLRLQRNWGGHLAQTPCSCRALEQGNPEPFSDSFWVSPRTETPKTPRATCADTPSSSQCFLKFKGNLLCFSLWPLTLVMGYIWKRTILCCLCALPSGIYTHL